MNIPIQNTRTGKKAPAETSAAFTYSRLVSFCLDSDRHPALVAYATPLINFAIFLKYTKITGDFNRLRNLAVQMLSRYRQTLAAAAVKKNDAVTAHYILCATIDDAVLGKPWSVRAGWAECGLTANFHRDVNSGERFFEILNKNIAEQKHNKPLLILFYYCLSLCFEGKLKITENNKEEKERYLDIIYNIIKGDYNYKSSLIRSATRQMPLYQRKLFFRLRPALFTAFIAANLLCAITCYALLHPARDKAVTALDLLTQYKVPTFPPLDIQSKPASVTPAQMPPPQPELAELLAPEIAQKTIIVSKQQDNTLFIRILQSPLFASASDKLDPQATALINRIAGALIKTSRNITVVGYTDSQPIRSARFSSNLLLSQARAETIAALLQAAMPDIHITALGKGDANPVATNATPQGRALNRRVEIFITPKNATTTKAAPASDLRN
ncbi:type IVB secretion system protein IcmH/DotU [Pseudochrobactrum sp. HB0163]|uniref:type IVB secretion system protein IcmH/DotU n=1 Tax=Pseudochrobactrum sp. HB0163 TaxID=3450708 RepID=UPI003F6DAB7F